MAADFKGCCEQLRVLLNSLKTMIINILIDHNRRSWSLVDSLCLYYKIILPVAKAYRPQLMLVSAGFDAYMEDPLAGMRVTPAGFASMARHLKVLADTVCQGRMVLILEGGYHLEGLRESVLRVLDQLCGHPGSVPPSGRSDLFEAVLASARTHFGNHWKF